jgi:hypothetical protein
MYTEIGWVVLQPHPEPTRAVVVVAATYYHPAEGNITAARRHQPLKARQVLPRCRSRQVTHNMTVDLHRDSVRVIRVRGLWNQHRDDLTANPLSEGPAAQWPQGGLVGEFTNNLKIFLPVQQRNRRNGCAFRH